MATAVATTTTQPSKSGKQKGALKKVLKYFQDQALENSNSRSFLSPPGLEPHQRFHLSSPRSQHNQLSLDLAKPSRRLSEATTAVEQRFRRPGPMAGDGVDVGVIQEEAVSTSREMKKVQYAQDNILQNYRLYVPERNPETVQGDQYWIIYIHGGYFRDPKVDATSFRSALELLTAEESTESQGSSLQTVPESTEASPVSSRGPFAREHELIDRHVAGYASINYRLSPHPAYPQNENTENYVRRNAEFPQQLQDVYAAIRHLQTRHDIGSNYILSGHSVGATLTFLAALKAAEGQIDPPACIVGLNGIYDFPAIHKSNPDYEAMTKNAMRPDQYETASPALYAQSKYLNILPKQALRVLLSHSKDDGLVVWEQVERMQATLLSDPSQTQLDVELIETKGQHDAIWGEGRELARTLVEALQMVTSY